MGRAFESIYDMQGDYSGNYDGRPCDLTISFEGGEGTVTVQLSFHDLERNMYFWAPNAGGSAVLGQYPVDIPWTQFHTIGNIYFWEVDSDGNVLYGPNHGGAHWDSLAIHTWNIDYLSGVSEWNGQYYGMSFTRKGAPPLG